MKRLFIALRVPNSPEIQQVTKKLRISADQKKLDIRWVAPELYHITLCFLGDTEEEHLPALRVALEELGRSHSPFKLKLIGMGGFPDERQTRVLWIGVPSKSALLNLKSDLALKLEDRDFAVDDRSYRPHCTVARLRSPKSIADLISPFSRKELLRWEAKDVTLFESQGQGQNIRYLPLLSVALSHHDEEGPSN